jgi:hypothetical protein
MKSVAVLGCGPSGLMAAHAAKKLGHDVTIYSVKEKSPILGGQYLHVGVTGITGEASNVTYIKVGDTEGYSSKVYGKPDVPCFRFPAGEYPAWSLTEAYNNLWGIWEDAINGGPISADDIEEYCAGFDIVLCTIPRKFLCYKGDHRFFKQDIVVAQNGTLINPLMENVVLYSGRSRDAWYRTSNLFGHHTTEWSAAARGWDMRQLLKHFKHFRPEGEEIRIERGFKPLGTDCDCHTEFENFHRLGRFGQWNHGVLVSDALSEAETICNEASGLVTT